jgi:hypothetical protein
MITHHAITSAITVKPLFANIFDNREATVIRIQDEGGGCFVEVEQSNDGGLETICIDVDEWPLIRSAIDEMIELADKLNSKRKED